MRERTHLDLFSGIGGFALAAQWAGYRTVVFCECEPFCQAVLRKHWPSVPIHSDIRKLDGRQFAGVDLLTGGFPCQPFSFAGKRRGKEDDRYLWPEMLRFIKEARPRNIIAENVVGLLSLVEPNSLSDVEIKEIELFQSDDTYQVNSIIERVQRRIIGVMVQGLEKIGYDFPRLADGTPIVLLIPACAVDAKHRRDRVWIVGATHTCADRVRPQRFGAPEIGTWSEQEFKGLVQDQLRVSIPTGKSGGVYDGVSNRLHRLKSLGNAIVPQVAFQIIKAITQTESERNQ